MRTPEERKLRRFVTGDGFFIPHRNADVWLKQITAMRKAIIEECAKKCDEMAAHYKGLRLKGEPEISKIDQDTLRMFAAEDCAAAIRFSK